MDCWSAANLPRLAAHSLSMASRARVTNPPAAPAIAADLTSSSGRGERWLDPRRGSAHGVEGKVGARSGEGVRSDE
jgi:hypothetical protein